MPKYSESISPLLISSSAAACAQAAGPRPRSSENTGDHIAQVLVQPNFLLGRLAVLRLHCSRLMRTGEGERVSQVQNKRRWVTHKAALTWAAASTSLASNLTARARALPAAPRPKAGSCATAPACPLPAAADASAVRCQRQRRSRSWRGAGGSSARTGSAQAPDSLLVHELPAAPPKRRQASATQAAQAL